MDLDLDPADNSPDVHRLSLGDRQVVLIGTAHISRESAELARQVIIDEKPDRVCLELDDKRYKSLADRHKFAALDLKKIIREKQLSTLLVNLVLASYQKKLGSQLGVMPGTEFLEAARAAAENGIPVSLCDRDLRVTLRRAWHAVAFYKKGYLLASLLASLFDRTEISEEKIAELKSQDVLSEIMAELGRELPELKKALIDERDFYLAEKIRAAEGKRLLAVVGAGHVAGIKEILGSPSPASSAETMAEISSIPPVSGLWKIIGWAIPALIILSLVIIGWQQGSAVAGANLKYWILANGIPSSIGAMLAGAHPLTIITAFVAAPITSLTPVIGAGYVTAFIQLMLRPPVVREFETALEDMATLRGWWKNKLLRILLAFIFPGLGSMIGTWIGGYEIVSNLF